MNQDLFTPTELKLPERNKNGNDAEYQQNKPHFKSQTEKVLEVLLKGEPVTSLRMIQEFGIIDTRARIYALKKSGYVIGERKVKGGNGSKEWYLEPNEIERLKNVA